MGESIDPSPPRQKRRHRAVMVAVVCCVVFLLALGVGVVVQHGYPPSSSTQSHKTFRPFTAPGFYRDFPGITPESLAERLVLVNVFASWCVPCLAEHPYLMDLSALPGLEMVGLAFKDNPQNIRDFLDKLGNPFDQVGIDQTGMIGVEIGLTGVPETFLVARDGRVLFHRVGGLTEDIMRRELGTVLEAAGVAVS